MRFNSHFLRNLAAYAPLVVVAAVTSGCAATADVPPEPAPIQPISLPYAEPNPDLIPVLRQGRYTLVELAPASEQRNLMRQVVTVSIAAGRRRLAADSVPLGLQAVLRR